MAHRSHEIPWGSLVSNFQFSKRRDQGDAGNDIWALDKPNQGKSLTHFAKAFARSLREYSKIERHKYASADDYHKRAKTWTKSDRRPDSEIQELSCRQASDASTETRKVFSDHDRDLWTARRLLYRQDSLINETQYIENWIMGKLHWSDSPNSQHRDQSRDKWVGNWTDNIKALMMEAALVTTPLHQRQTKRDQSSPSHVNHMDSLFLLAHHPEIPLLSWTHEGDACCNMESGLVCIIEAALTGYIYLNMLYTMRELGSRVCQITDPNMEHQHSHQSQYHAARKLSTRPIYMNTRSWSRFLQKVCPNHAHHPEVMIFEPFFYPREGQNFSLASSEHTLQAPNTLKRRDISQMQQVDVMTPSNFHLDDDRTLANSLSVRGSAKALHEFLRGLWKLMVNYEMLWTDMGAPPKWEVMIADMLETCFRRFTGKRYSLFWDTYDQSATYRLSDLFEGRVAPEEDHPVETLTQKDEQKAKNRNYRREANRLARSN